MKRAFSTLLGSSLLAAGMTFAAPAFAVPNLQLDILGGSYDNADESIFTTNDLFTVNAYCSPTNQNNCLTKQHFLSIAILDQNGNKVTAGTDFGSFKVGTTTYGIGGNALTYGTPPFNDPAGAGSDPQDLQPHGVFPTLFTEVGFSFDGSRKRDEVNTQDDPGTAIVNTSATPDMFYTSFAADMTGLKTGYRLHFDLYNEDRKSSDWDVKQNAPFSHDAYAKKTTTEPPAKTPEPAAMVGIGLVGAAMAMSRRQKASKPA